MNAKKCDRCNRFYEPYKPDETLKHSNMLIFAEDHEDAYGNPDYVEWRQFELCQDCMADAVRFIQALMGGE